MLPPELDKLEWHAPWHPVRLAEARGFENELHRELGHNHLLKNIMAIAIATRLDNDDVLFFLPQQPRPFAVVHLTYAGHEFRAEWPETRFFDSLLDWVERCMKRDHFEYESNSQK